MSKLLIVESPAKAGTIKKYLGKGYDVVASVGHVRDLPVSSLGVDVNHDFQPKYIMMRGKKDVINEIRKKAAKSDMVYLATDPDREGEAISWHLAYMLGLDLDQKNRITFNEISKKAVTEGIKHPRSINLDMVDAQQARRVLDRLVGYKISPFLWKKIKKGLSAGRVQSVVLRLLCDREREIEEFDLEEYWTLDAQFKGIGKAVFTAHFYGNAAGKIELKNQAETDRIIGELSGAAYTVTGVTEKKKTVKPLPPFITSTLQREASRKFGYRPEVTMRNAQQLYEGVEIKGQGSTGLITYMRTDSLRLSDDAVAAAREYILQEYGKDYCPSSPNVFTKSKKAQDAHEAIRPTDVNLTPDRVKDSLTAQQFHLYKLIWSRFIACQMTAKILNTTAVEITANGYLFKFAHSKIRFDGFSRLYSDPAEGEDGPSKGIPELSQGDVLPLLRLVPEQKFTQPPARYTDDTIIKVMEEKGIGRPSTYAPTIATLIGRYYAERQKKSLVPTPLGETVNQVMVENFPEIVDVKFTAGMEEDLEKIAEGDTPWVNVVRDFYQDFSVTLEKADKKFEGVRIKVPEEVTDVICEKCGRNMVIRNGRNGKFLACPGFPECRNTKSIQVETEGNCPVCGAKMLEKKSKKGKVYYACANYPDCRYMTWDKPLAETCPKCGKTLFRELRRGGKIHCLNDGCGYERIPEKKKSEEKAEE